MFKYGVALGSIEYLATKGKGEKGLAEDAPAHPQRQSYKCCMCVVCTPELSRLTYFTRNLLPTIHSQPPLNIPLVSSRLSPFPFHLLTPRPSNTNLPTLYPSTRRTTHPSQPATPNKPLQNHHSTQLNSSPLLAGTAASAG
jgi:hypothetical protein